MEIQAWGLAKCLYENFGNSHTFIRKFQAILEMDECVPLPHPSVYKEVMVRLKTQLKTKYVFIKTRKKPKDTKKMFEILRSGLMGNLGLKHIAWLSNKFSWDKFHSRDNWTVLKNFERSFKHCAFNSRKQSHNWYLTEN